jgi:hypothetical protein
MGSLRLLFETQEAAREVALMLRCEYDGCNMIKLPSVHDTLALRTAIELTGADFCFDGDHYPIVLPFSDNELSGMNREQQAGQVNSRAELWCSEFPNLAP